jgi:hypothetical protein
MSDGSGEDNFAALIRFFLAKQKIFVMQNSNFFRVFHPDPKGLHLSVQSIDPTKFRRQRHFDPNDRARDGLQNKKKKKTRKREQREKREQVKEKRDKKTLKQKKKRNVAQYWLQIKRHIKHAKCMSDSHSI